MNAQPLNETEFTVRGLDELLEAARALNPDDTDAIEAIVDDCDMLTPIKRRQVFEVLKEVTGVPLSALNEQRRSTQQPEPDHLDLARQVIEMKGRENLLCTEAHVWGWRDTGVWVIQEDRAVKQEVQSALDLLPGLEVMSGTVNSVTDVLKTEIFAQGHEFNQGNLEAVNCINGQVEHAMDRWMLKPHNRDEYRTTQIPVAFDPSATAPRFEAFLGQVFDGDQDGQEKRQALLELIGYTLMSHARHEKFVILIGAGANGKSVLLSVLYALVGRQNVAGVKPSNFDNRFQRAHLNQKLANIVTELRQGEVIADAELKAITSGEPATVENKHKDPFVMRPFATCWFGTNHMPHTRDFSEALFRRATILTFNRVFAPHEQDPVLKDKLLDELPGILALALDAYGAALRDGFTRPQSSEAAKDEWRLEADQVAMFVEDVCERETFSAAPISEVFSAYKDWACENGIGKHLSVKSMRNRLNKLGFGNEHCRSGRIVLGLRLKDRSQPK